MSGDEQSSLFRRKPQVTGIPLRDARFEGKPKGMKKIEVDREKYRAMARKHGPEYAITFLHREINEIENECFEGADGYRPDIWETLRDLRDFSRELWQIQREIEENEAKAAGHA